MNVMLLSVTERASWRGGGHCAGGGYFDCHFAVGHVDGFGVGISVMLSFGVAAMVGISLDTIRRAELRKSHRLSHFGTNKLFRIGRLRSWYGVV